MNNYPDLSKNKIISFDIETYDPELKDSGPGVYRKDGNILGIGIATEDGFSNYYDLAHPGCTPELKEKNLNYLKEVLSLQVPKIGTNILYDLDWCENWGNIKVNGGLNDVMVAESLIDENRKTYHISHPYSLEALSYKYVGKGKAKTKINDFCTRHNLKGDSRKWLWKMSADLVGEYGVADVRLPIEVFKKQYAVMHKEKLLDLYKKVEMPIHRLLLQMRKNGVKVDPNKVQRNIVKLNKLIVKKQEEMNYQYGKFNFNSSKQLARQLDKLGVKYPLTDKGNPSLGKDNLANLDHLPVVKDTLEIKSMHKTLNTFLINAIHNNNILGRVHCSFYPTSTDDFGTKSGRFSSANPNLQQVPSKPPYTKLTRGVFIPEEGHFWAKLDYSQIEYRIIAHYAQGPKSDEVRQKYNDDPDTDYHKLVMDWAGLERKSAKNLNFGASYCMGIKTCARKFHWSLQEAESLLKHYHTQLPFIKVTRDNIITEAKCMGFVKTILNRRARVTELMRINRKEYSMFNRLIQGSAADIMKKGMVDAYNKGLFDILIPHLTVHDEMDVSVPNTKLGIEALRELQFTMENCVALRVPIKVDVEMGFNWGNLKEMVYVNKKWKEKVA